MGRELGGWFGCHAHCAHFEPPCPAHPPCRIAARLGAAAPSLAVLPGCGHVSFEERPAMLLDFLAAFVSDVQHAL